MSRLPSTGPSLQRYLRQQARTAQRQQQSSAFARSGTTVTAEGAQSLDGTLVVAPGSGFVSIDGSLAVHGTAAFDGTTTIGGDLIVAGTLSLPNSIIGNDALTSPVASVGGFNSASNYGLTTSDVDVVVVPFTVPAGLTKVTVIAASYFSILSAAGTTGTSVFTTLAVDGDLSTDSETKVHSTFVSMDTQLKNHTQSMLNVAGGNTFSVRLKARGSVANPASISNTAWVKVSVIYTR